MGVLNKNGHRTESCFRYMNYNTHPCHFIDEIEFKRDCGGQMDLLQFSAKPGIHFKHLNFKFSYFPYKPPKRLANNSLDNHIGNLIYVTWK